jgi:hypothetical protein
MQPPGTHPCAGSFKSRDAAYASLSRLGRIDTPDLLLEAPRHPAVAQRAGKFGPLLKNLDRTRYVSLAEKNAGLAKDPGIAPPLLGLIRGSHHNARDL